MTAAERCADCGKVYTGIGVVGLQRLGGRLVCRDVAACERRAKSQIRDLSQPGKRARRPKPADRAKSRGGSVPRKKSGIYAQQRGGLSRG